MNLGLLAAWWQRLLAALSYAHSVLKIFFLRFAAVLKFIALYIAVAGIVGFSIFIHEEAIQLLSFANFSASDTRQYHLLKDNLDHMKEINESLRWLNNHFMWMVPPQLLGYRHYANATDAYIRTLTAEVLRHDPAALVGERVDMPFVPESLSPGHNGLWIARARGVRIILKSEPTTKTVFVSGVLRPDPEFKGGVVIEAE